MSLLRNHFKVCFIFIIVIFYLRNINFLYLYNKKLFGDLAASNSTYLQYFELNFDFYDKKIINILK